MGETRKDKLQLIVRRFFLIITDIILINGSVILSLVMRFNVDIAAIETQYIESFKDTWILVFQDVSQSVAVCKYSRAV